MKNVKLCSLFILFLAFLSFQAQAIVTVELLLEDGITSNALGEFTGSGDVDPNGLVRLSSESYAFYEDDGDAAPHQLILFDADAAGGGLNRFKQLATETEILTVAGITAIGATVLVSDMDTDSDTDDIYIYCYRDDIVPNENFVVRIPSLGLGTDNFGAVEIAASTAAMLPITGNNGVRRNALYIDTRPNPNEIVMLIDTPARDTTTNGLYKRAVDAGPNDPNILIADYAQLGAGTSPPSIPGQDTVGFTDVANHGAENYLLQGGENEATKRFRRSNDEWRYLDDGSDQGTAWKEEIFDDSTWSTGTAKFGYGDGNENTLIDFGTSATTKHITYYFRTTFEVLDHTLYTNLNFPITRDDGVLLYLNGTEIIRDNMVGGAIDYLTTAIVPVSGAAETTAVNFERNVTGLLKTGTNVVAVEIHQANPTSSDMGFILGDIRDLNSGPADGDMVLWDVAGGSASTFLNTPFSTENSPFIQMEDGNYAMYTVEGNQIGTEGAVIFDQSGTVLEVDFTGPQVDAGVPGLAGNKAVLARAFTANISGDTRTYGIFFSPSPEKLVEVRTTPFGEPSTEIKNIPWQNFE